MDAYLIFSFLFACTSLVILLWAIYTYRHATLRLGVFIFGFLCIGSFMSAVILQYEWRKIQPFLEETSRIEITVCRTFSTLLTGLMFSLYMVIVLERYERIFAVTPTSRLSRRIRIFKLFYNAAVIIYMGIGSFDRVYRMIALRRILAGRNLNPVVDYYIQVDELEKLQIYRFSFIHYGVMLLVVLLVAGLEGFVNLSLVRHVLGYNAPSLQGQNGNTSNEDLGHPGTMPSSHTSDSSSPRGKFTAVVREQLKRKFFVYLAFFIASDTFIMVFNSLGAMLVLPRDPTELLGWSWIPLHGIVAFRLLDLFLVSIKKPSAKKSKIWNLFSKKRSSRCELNVVGKKSSVNTSQPVVAANSAPSQDQSLILRY